MKNITSTAFLTLLLFSGIAISADGVTKEIIDRCRAQMGEHGSALVKVCVDKDIEAYDTLEKYPDEQRPFIDRCLKQMGEHGFALVKVCADKDIEAEEALSNY